MYVCLMLGGTLALYLIFKNRSDRAKERLIKVLASLPLILYIADFFIMPLAYGSIDIDKLPFHFCTLFSILIVFTQFGKRFAFMHEPVAALSIVTALMYLCYPGTAIGDISPFCYRVVQTFLFHGCVFAYGVIASSLGGIALKWRNIWKSAVMIVVILCWSAFGNAVYSTPERQFDWGFITGNTFPFIPKIIMPALVFFAVFGVTAAVYAIGHIIKKSHKVKRKTAHKRSSLFQKINALLCA